MFDKMKGINDMQETFTTTTTILFALEPRVLPVLRVEISQLKTT